MNDAERSIAEALAQFFPGDAAYTVSEGASGMNNTTRYVEAEGASYVVRLYAHRDEAKIACEHAALRALAAKPLPFRVPEPVAAPDGRTIVRAADGALAALFRRIPGARPSLREPEQLRAFGRAAGQLTRALRDLDERLPTEHAAGSETAPKEDSTTSPAATAATTPQDSTVPSTATKAATPQGSTVPPAATTAAPAYPPYYELDASYPRCTPEAVAAFRADPPAPFADLADELATLEAELADVRGRLPALRALPHQLVHGDLNASNALAAEDGSIVAILDFEFVTRDARVMEAAVCLSDLLDPDAPEAAMWANVNAFLDGYGSVVALEPEELDALPLLLRLRRLDVALHFLSRYWDGVDDADVLRRQLQSAHRVATWLRERGAALQRATARLRPQRP
ncbi:phosphotransferase [Paenibacillus sp. TRM 82003]|nr:phosphotransferase [Paenibacillus sp. TRM 82003]